MDVLIAIVPVIATGIVFKLLFYWSEKTSSFRKEDVHYEPPKYEPKQLTEEEECECKNVWDKKLVNNVLKKYPGIYGERIGEDENKLEWHAYLGYYDFLMKKYLEDTEEIDKVKFLIMLDYVGKKIPTFDEAYDQLRDWLIFH